MSSTNAHNGGEILTASEKASVIARLREMVRLQVEINVRINPSWRAQNLSWYRCIWTEAAELVADHYASWVWWKNKSDNLEQAQIEVIDILHFGISDLAGTQEDSAVDALLDGYLQALRFKNTLDDILPLAEEVAGQAITTKRFPVAAFWRLAFACGMDIDQIYRTYVSKCTLNLFRQDHGYKDGSYRKLWAGIEDNEHLARIAARIQLNESFSRNLYNELRQCYVALKPTSEK